MENEKNNSVVEVFVRKMTEDKSRFCVFISGIISAICSFLFMVEMSLSTIPLLFTICIFAAAIGNVIYVLDINGKKRYAQDIVVGGIALSLLGSILRVIQLGIAFSIRYFISYAVYCVAFVLLSVKLSKNQGKEKALLFFLGVLTVYAIAEFFLLNLPISGFIWKIYHIAEAFLFLSYMGILYMNRKEPQMFSDKVRSYKQQIPSVKICVLILAFISLISFAIGGIIELNKQKTSVISQVEVVQKEDTEKQAEPVENKAKGTVKQSGTENTEENTGAPASPQSAEVIPDITLGQTIAANGFEFTLNRVELSYDVEPDNPPSYYTHYAASQGQVYIYVNATVKNTGKHSLECDNIYSVIADYNHGYTYRGFHIASDSDGDFTYANITNVEPLQTLGVHCLIDCPQEVEASENPLVLTIQMKDGTKYKYTVR